MKEKEKSPSGRGEYSAEEIESLVLTLDYIKERVIKIDTNLEHLDENYKNKVINLYNETVNRTISILKSLV